MLDLATGREVRGDGIVSLRHYALFLRPSLGSRPGRRYREPLPAVVVPLHAASAFEDRVREIRVTKKNQLMRSVM